MSASAPAGDAVQRGSRRLNNGPRGLAHGAGAPGGIPRDQPVPTSAVPTPRRGSSASGVTGPWPSQTWITPGGLLLHQRHSSFVLSAPGCECPGSTAVPPKAQGHQTAGRARVPGARHLRLFVTRWWWWTGHRYRIRRDVTADPHPRLASFPRRAQSRLRALGVQLNRVPCRCSDGGLQRRWGEAASDAYLGGFGEAGVAAEFGGSAGTDPSWPLARVVEAGGPVRLQPCSDGRNDLQHRCRGECRHATRSGRGNAGSGSACTLGSPSEECGGSE